MDQTRITLTQYLIAQRRRFPQASGNFNALILDIAMACKRMSHLVSMGELGPSLPALNDAQLEGQIQTPAVLGTGRYFVLFRAIDKSRPLDVNATVGSVFSIVRSAHEFNEPQRNPDEAVVLENAQEIVASGYAIYGPATMLVLTVGQGVVAFTLDPNFGEFMMTRVEVRVAEDTREFAVNASNRRHWPQPVQRYVEECLAGRSGVRGADFNMRWMGSVVADAHRILLQGGVCIYPRDQDDTTRTGQIHAWFIARPIAFLIEQAGGRASTGYQPLDRISLSSFSQRIPLIFGSRHEVERIERYWVDPQSVSMDLPLFGERTLFRDWALPSELASTSEATSDRPISNADQKHQQGLSAVNV